MIVAAAVVADALEVVSEAVACSGSTGVGGRSR